MSFINLQKSPILHLKNLSQKLKCNIYVKDESQCHSNHGGNKTRKLAYIFKKAIFDKATDLITMGAIGSNHILATSYHAKKINLNVYGIVLPHPKTKRSLSVCQSTLDLGTQLIPAKNDLDLLIKVFMIKRKLLKQGRKPFIIGPGGSSEYSSQTYIDAVKEAQKQINLKTFDATFCAIGSGGTFSGLWAATELLNLPWQLYGVSVRNGLAHSRLLLKRRAKKCLTLYKNASSSLNSSHAKILKSFIGKGYGISDTKSLQAIDDFGLDKVFLEPSYTAKTAAAMIELISKNPQWQNVLFWQTANPDPMVENINISKELRNSFLTE